MLTVTLVATLASAALWQQWRSVEIEEAERSRSQMQWILNGALDWSRLILQEDSRADAVDHLSEPWAVPLKEARLSSFLALDKNNTDDAMDAFLSGQISDQQALLNVRNLVRDGKPNLPATQAFARLFDRLKLPRAQLLLLINGLLASDAAASPDARAQGSATAPLQPTRLQHLVWLGLPASSVQTLAPYATLLPVPTPLNLNTASAEVLSAALPGLDLAQAQALVQKRANAHFQTLAEALKAAGVTDQSSASDFSVGSRFFAVRGRLRLGPNTVQELSLVERKDNRVLVLWRQREAAVLSAGPASADAAAASLQ
jgi:general secretion pathway protein K